MTDEPRAATGPAPVARVIVIGTSGAGKTSFARELARRAGLPHVELDALHWAPRWTERPRAEFLAGVRAATAGERWVVDGNYSISRPITWTRATQIVWLNYGRAVVWPRVLWRTLARTLSREPLWHGNRESLLKAFGSRDSILLWSVQTFAKNRAKYAALRASGEFPQAEWLEFRDPRQARAWLRQMQAQPRD